jgi:cation diffusion facilitator CzcD-associated flavoprotein CzcO
MPEVVDAVIVGGGYAGLAAARRLTEEGAPRWCWRRAIA